MKLIVRSRKRGVLANNNTQSSREISESIQTNEELRGSFK